jgi:hypothetical protein
VRRFEPDLAFPPTLKVRLAAGTPYLSDQQVDFLLKCLRGQGRAQLADAIEAARQGSGAFTPAAEQKVELLRVMRLWPNAMRADHRVAALLHCLRRDTGQSDEPPSTHAWTTGSAKRILRKRAAALSRLAAAVTDFLR